MTNTKHDPFKSISENLPFWPDQENVNPEPFEGVFIDDSLVLGEDPDPTKNIPVFIFADAKTGEKFFIVKAYAINKAVEKVKAVVPSLENIVFRFDFKGKTMSKGKPYNQFDTAYCTVQEYNLMNAEPEAKEKKK